jgi:hypothetical protein
VPGDVGRQLPGQREAVSLLGRPLALENEIRQPEDKFEVRDERALAEQVGSAQRGVR